MLNQLIHQVWHTNCLYLDGEQDVNTLFPLLANHAFRFSIYDQQAVDGLLKAFIAGILEESSLYTMPSRRPIQLYAHFIDLLMGRQDLQRKINYFARALHTTPQNLNAACRKSDRKSTRLNSSH